MDAAAYYAPYIPKISIRPSMFPGVFETFDGTSYIPYNIHIQWRIKDKQHKGKERCRQSKKKWQHSINVILSGTTI
jgi:hypothetical protein